jgi:hypothetical protein
MEALKAKRRNMFKKVFDFLKYPNLCFVLTDKTLICMSNGKGFVLYQSLFDNKIKFSKFENAYKNLSREEYFAEMQKNKKILKSYAG